jgi:hypothetical protein
MSSTSARAGVLPKTSGQAAEREDRATTAASSCEGLMVGVGSAGEVLVEEEVGMAGAVEGAGSVVQSGGRVLGRKAMSTTPKVSKKGAPVRWGGWHRLSLLQPQTSDW